MTKLATITFESSREVLKLPLDSVHRAYRYHGPQVGQWMDAARTEFRVPAPKGPRDFKEMIERHFSRD